MASLQKHIEEGPQCYSNSCCSKKVSETGRTLAPEPDSKKKEKKAEMTIKFKMGDSYNCLPVKVNQRKTFAKRHVQVFGCRTILCFWRTW